ncbi:MAG: hypothetical protein LBQ00_07435 [Syntrophobacterales bacterium]|jgi:hypothetical protein|nr:hypothetical protein [Syntrophobacterales bacterium]
MNHYRDTYEKVIKDFNSNEAGLSQAKAEKQLLENGKNKLTKAEKSILRRFI